MPKSREVKDRDSKGEREDANVSRGRESGVIISAYDKVNEETRAPKGKEEAEAGSEK